jgi:hypothetical protein
MKPLTAQERTEMLDNLVGVLVSCPVDHRNPPDCPLCAIRKMEMTKRLQWLNSLHDDELAYLNSYHFVCLRTKLEAYLVGASH